MSQNNRSMRIRTKSCWRSRIAIGIGSLALTLKDYRGPGVERHAVRLRPGIYRGLVCLREDLGPQKLVLGLQPTSLRNDLHSLVVDCRHPCVTRNVKDQQ